ncbi:MAG: hypothetical protein OXU64_00110 [Gemmatimonadota bacterium]|nr:hypothetical protein [Gemmatimonadota bacterium]
MRALQPPSTALLRSFRRFGTESTRLADMIRVESATWAAAAACYYLVKTPERWR